MEDLIELTQLVSRQKVKRIEILGQANKYSQKSELLYDLIASGKIKTNEQAALALYENQESSKENLRKLKHRLKDKLINTLFFIDMEKVALSEVQKSYMEICRAYTATEILLERGAKKTGLAIAKKTLKKTKEFEFTRISFLLSAALRKYSALAGRHKDFIYYKNECKEFEKILQAETLAEEFYYTLILNYSTTKSSRKEVLKKELESSLIELEECKKNVNSYRFSYLYYLGMAFYYVSQNNMELTIQTCKNSLAFFKSHKKLRKATLFNFNLQLLNCYLRLKKFKEGQDCFLENRNYVKAGTLNWSHNTMSFVLICLHTQNYQEAYNVFLDTISSPSFKKLSDARKQDWFITQSYIEFLILRKKINPETRNKDRPNFKLYKFLNDTPIFSKDKRGANISILVIQILLQLEMKQYQRVIDRVDSLNQYVFRYLRKDETFRSNCFLKMLLLIPKADFNRIRTERYAQALYNKLLSSGETGSEQSSEIEYIPYEDLWEFAKELLD